MRDLIGATAAGAAPRVRVRLDTQMVPNLKSGTVWGTLPGTSDETVFIVAHRDGWFDGANDNGAGVATMIGLAEFFAKMTPQQRKRTITFLGTTGHHNSGPNSGAWFAEHPEVFAKASLLSTPSTPAPRRAATTRFATRTRPRHPLGTRAGRGSPRLS